MPLKIHLLGILIFLQLFLLSLKSQQTQNQTAYEVLESYNFPRGILSMGVTSYVLNEDGGFVVHLESSCKFSIEAGYTLEYRNKITGVLKYGSLKNLQGVSVKVLFFWLGINDVDRAGGQLQFYVGPLFASLSLSNFYASAKCGCGFDCVDRVPDSCILSSLVVNDS